MKTLQQILIESAALLDLTAALPTGTELTTRSSYANQALFEAANVGVLNEFKRPVVTFATTATLSLGANFKEFLDKPRVMTSGGAWEDYVQITPEEAREMVSTDKYCYVTGNPQSGYFAYFNNMATGATISYIEHRYPSGMATLTSICELTDPQYIVLKTSAYVLKSRGDERFPIVDSDAETRLRNIYARQQRRPLGGDQQVRRTGAASYSIS
jgi:hypothetical protein